MNRKEWKEFCKLDKGKAHLWYNKARQKLISKEFESLENCDKDAKVIHHLRDTEEQRKYNDEHYELFGFELDEDGNETFTYGKYVVFWTKEHHNEYHSCSEETRKKLSISCKAAKNDKDARKEMSDRTKNLWQDESFRLKMFRICSSKEHKDKLSKAHLGHTHTEETKKKMSEIRKGHVVSEETREKIGFANKGNKARLGMKNSKESNEKRSMSMKGFRHSDKSKAKMSISSKKSKGIRAAQFKVYKRSGGKLSWNEFQANFKAMFADKFSIGTEKQMKALKEARYDKCDYDTQCEYLKKINLYDDDGYIYGSQWLYRAIPVDVIKEIKSLMAS